MSNPAPFRLPPWDNVVSNIAVSDSTVLCIMVSELDSTGTAVTELLREAKTSVERGPILKQKKPLFRSSRSNVTVIV